eukprot:1828333-Pyramimonas_sp.AAC.1
MPAGDAVAEKLRALLPRSAPGAAFCDASLYTRAPREDLEGSNIPKQAGVRILYDARYTEPSAQI